MRLLLIRHWQTPSNVQGLLDTAAPGPGLTVLGERQAAAVPAALADGDIDAIAVSPLVRTSSTATPLATARGLAPVTFDGLREVVGDPSRGWKLVLWSPEPVGGLELSSRAAEDPTGEAVDR